MYSTAAEYADVTYVQFGTIRFYYKIKINKSNPRDTTVFQDDGCDPRSGVIKLNVECREYDGDSGTRAVSAQSIDCKEIKRLESGSSHNLHREHATTWLGRKISWIRVMSVDGNVTDDDQDESLDEDQECESARRAWTESVGKCLHFEVEPWSLTPVANKQEDKVILRFVAEHGNCRWVQIASMLQGRSGKQCRERYDPTLWV